MASEISREIIRAATNGQHDDSSADTIDKLAAVHLRNLLTHKKGALVLRGPIRTAYQVNTDLDQVAYPSGIWSFDDKLLIGYREFHATRRREPWRSIGIPNTDATILAQAYVTGAAIQFDHVNLTTHATTRVTDASRVKAIGPRFARVGNYVYGLGYDSVNDTVATSPGAAVAGPPATWTNGISSGKTGYRIRHTQLLRWDGTAAAPTTYQRAPLGAVDIIAHANRLFVLGGVDPNWDGTAPSGALISDAPETSVLYYTDIFDPTVASMVDANGILTLPDAASAWQDDISTSTNKIPVGSNDPNDPGVGLARIGQNLFIFKRRSIHVLLGYSAQTFAMRPVRQDLGCLDARSITEVDGGVFFMSERGFMFFDGSEVRDASGQAQSSVNADALRTAGFAGVDGGAVIGTPHKNNYVALTVSALPWAAGATGGKRSRLIHYPDMAHTVFTSGNFGAGDHNEWDLGDTRVPLLHGRAADGTPWFFDNSNTAHNLYEAPHLTTPEAAPLATNNAHDLTIAAANVAIPAEWWTRAIVFDATARAKLQRILMIYKAAFEGSADGALATTWRLIADEFSLGSGSANLVATDTQSTTDRVNAGYLPDVRRQAHIDSFMEVAIVQIRVTWSPTSTATLEPGQAEIQNILIEYQRGAEWRGHSGSYGL